MIRQNLSRVIGSFAKKTFSALCETKKSIAKASLTVLTLLFFLLGSASASNIQIANGRVVQVGSDRFIEFDLSWDNSWRDAFNWDAAWVFVKYRVQAAHGGDDVWKHVWLNTTNDTHSTGTGTGASIKIGTTTISGTARGMGAFIYRSALGSGTFSLTDTRLKWSYAEQGISASTILEIRVFAVEMVHAAQGAFNVGSGGTESGSFTNGSWTSGATIPLSVSSENALTIGTSSGNLWGTSSTGLNAIGGAGTLPAAFPKGFAAFYLMKYETSQQQYVDFLNTLTRSQQDERFSSTIVGDFMYSAAGQNTPAIRNGVRLMSDPGSPAGRVFGCDLNTNNTAGEATDGQWAAMNWLSWMDATAYLDWAGLRPMTELEFEKAMRGPATPAANEYAWGTSSIASEVYTISNAGAANEGIATNYNNSGTEGNALYVTTSSSIGGPLRVGIFAANSTNIGRVSSGASYWGIMELSGNLWERVVTVGNETGRGFTGLHGDGALSANGHANETAWPGLVSGEVTDAVGSGFRGGFWNIDALALQVSDRMFATYTYTPRGESTGIRGLRMAP